MNKSTPLSILAGSVIIAAAIIYSSLKQPEIHGSIVASPPSMESVRKQFTQQFTSSYGYDGWQTPDGKVSEIASCEFKSAKYSADLKLLELQFTYKLKNGHGWDSSVTFQADPFFNYTGSVAGRVMGIK